MKLESVDGEGERMGRYSCSTVQILLAIPTRHRQLFSGLSVRMETQRCGLVVTLYWYFIVLYVS
jgi:hypothetical protein